MNNNFIKILILLFLIMGSFSVSAQSAENAAIAVTVTMTIANRAPSVGTIEPASGSSTADTAVSFTTTYSDPDGWSNIQYARFLINTSITGANCFYVYYDQNTNKLYLRDDADTTWLGGFSPGSANVIENSYAKLNCASTTISGTGTTLTANWSVNFKPNFIGSKNTYLRVIDDAGSSQAWTQAGAWTINP